MTTAVQAEMEPIELFYSYSHKDEKLRGRLETHLALLRRQGAIDGWHDRRIGPGSEWNDAIGKHLKAASVILLLVSADFVASDYCYSKELVYAMERHAIGMARVIPVILRPCDWTSAPFGKLQALPPNGKPISKWSDRDEAFALVTRGIREVVETMKRRAPLLPADDGPASIVPKSESGEVKTSRLHSSPAAVDMASPPPQSGEHELKFVVTIDMPFESADEATLKNLIELLRRYSGDANLSVIAKERGSLKLLCASSREAYEQLQQRLRTGNFSELLGYEVKDIRLLSLNEEPGGEKHTHELQLENRQAAESSSGPVLVHSGEWPQVFVLMPFTPELRLIYEEHVKKSLLNAGLSVGSVDDLFPTEPTMIDLASAIDAAKVVVADCTGRNANVFYQIGVAYSKGKRTLLISQSRDDVPFDLRHLRSIVYESTAYGMMRFEHVLVRAVRSSMGGSPIITDGLEKQDLHAKDFSGANLTAANLPRADLTNADLSGAELVSAYLKSANLKHANLTGADLTRADLRYADLSEAQLLSARLTGADLRGADLTRASILDTHFAEVDLSETLGLDSVQHVGPSFITTDTIYKSRGKIPEVFLRGCGVPDDMIGYIKVIAGAGAIQYYSLFISYSTKDQEFAERLHADLQAKGVRCWFAPHDIQGGRRIHEQLDEAIRLHDKLLLILSEDSMQSEWVKSEIVNARTREDREKKQMLFPITLVPFEEIKNWELFDADTGIDSAREIREYFIPDFSNWKNHDSYQQAFQRLVGDLKAAVND